MSPLIFPLIGLLVVVAAWLHYLWLMPREQVPATPLVTMAGLTLGAALQIGGLWSAYGGPRGLLDSFGPTAAIAWLLVAAGWGLAGFFFWLMTQRHTPVGQLTIAVGEPLPSLFARDSAGAQVSTDSLRGHRTLFKLFRGHW